MSNDIKYVIFPTEWGYAGLAGSQKGIIKSCLPLHDPHKVKKKLFKGIKPAAYGDALFIVLQDQIKSYFRGTYVNFVTDVAFCLPEVSLFDKKVLNVCRKIPYGQTASYAELAKKIKRPDAARAVANALAKNPLPLIVPCHRVIRKNNDPGGFSAGGGKRMKQALLRHEKKLARLYN